ncbi:serine protease 27 [Amia ocellicauda]|uniref:serine protease 27 n=1 Tax=Amia ocellicauda TaxID=2972642 RepID=UPI003464B7AA
MLLLQLLCCLLTLNTLEVSSSPLSRSFIVGGQDAEEGRWPWQAYLQISLKYKPGYSTICGGSLVSERWVLTAAACFDDPYVLKTSSVRLGAYKLKIHNSHEIEIPIKGNPIIHEKYLVNKSRNGYDIALVELIPPVSYTRYISPVTLAEDDGDDFSRGWECWSTGWGRNGENDSLPSPNTLQEVQTPVITNIRCKHLRRSNIRDDMLCAGGEGKGTCKGDSGGPLVCREGKGDKWIQAGITSWGHHCATEKPGIKTRVSSFRSWIKKRSGV